MVLCTFLLPFISEVKGGRKVPKEEGKHRIVYISLRLRIEWMFSAYAEFDCVAFTRTATIGNKYHAANVERVRVNIYSYFVINTSASERKSAG